MFSDINLISYAVVSIVSFIMGATSRIGYYRIMGKKVALPFVSQTGKNITALSLVVGLVSVVTVFTVSSSASDTALCNQQFRDALAYNVMLGGEERDLNTRRDTLDSEFQAVITEALQEVVKATPDKAIEPLITLVQTTNRIIKDKQQINVELQASNEKRKPYPSPTCGE